MTASRDEIRSRVGAVTDGWVSDPDNPVVYTEWVDGRLAMRMAQITRDFTTVWVDVGDRSVATEAYVIPAGDHPEELFRQSLVRNARTWRVWYALDAQGGIVLRSRTAVDVFDESEFGLVMAEIYDQIEVAFRPLVAALRSSRDRQKNA